MAAKRVAGPDSRLIAFLGGINVGGHRVSMDALKTSFREMGHRDVSTFIASGNVIFTPERANEAPERATDAPERANDASEVIAQFELAIETKLEADLGYAVPTFVRSVAELIAEVQTQPFGDIAASHTHMLAFLKEAPTDAQAIESLGNDKDSFVLRGTYLHWHIRGGFSDSSYFKNKHVAKALSTPYTTRNLKSLHKLAQRLASSPE